MHASLAIHSRSHKVREPRELCDHLMPSATAVLKGFSFCQTNDKQVHFFFKQTVSKRLFLLHIVLKMVCLSAKIAIFSAPFCFQFDCILSFGRHRIGLVFLIFALCHCPFPFVLYNSFMLLHAFQQIHIFISIGLAWLRFDFVWVV